MKKTLFILLGLACALWSGAQEPTEEESQKIVRSEPSQRALNARLEVAEAIYVRLQKGVSKETLKGAFDKALAKGSYENFYLLAFGSVARAEELLKTLGDAQEAFRKAYPEVMKLGACSSCPADPRAEFDFLLTNIDSFHKLAEERSAVTQKTIAPLELDDDPTCGSWGNQLKLLACGALCTGSGPAVVACGWACWCIYCRQNSVLAGAICSN